MLSCPIFSAPYSDPAFFLIHQSKLLIVYSLFIAIKCSPLFLDNGTVAYAFVAEGGDLMSDAGSGSAFFYDKNEIPLYAYGVTAMYSCNNGFLMAGGNATRVCDEGNGFTGEWSGMEPMCESMCIWSHCGVVSCKGTTTH